MFFIAIGIAKYANLLDFSCCAEPLKHTAGLHQLLHLIRIWGNGRFLVAPFYLHEPVFKIDREHLTFLNAIRITCDNGESNVNAIAIKNSGERLCDHRRNPRFFDHDRSRLSDSATAEIFTGHDNIANIQFIGKMGANILH